MSLPEIVFENPSDRSRSSRLNAYNPRSPSIASPMSIPNSREAGPPPPLPPPRNIDGPNVAWEWGQRRNPWANTPAASVHEGSSLLGGFSRNNSISEWRPEFSSRKGSAVNIPPLTQDIGHDNLRGSISSDSSKLVLPSIRSNLGGYCSLLTGSKNVEVPIWKVFSVLF